MRIKDNLIDKSLNAHKDFIGSMSNEALDMLMSEFDDMESEVHIEEFITFDSETNSFWLQTLNRILQQDSKPPNIVAPSHDVLQKEPSEGSFFIYNFTR